eukprot:GHVO01056545.1.p2 GENE.GHVO01056545.1~~GHVO01056545.1.p2  ORF type:complete len:214 (+),score=43.65 GHVO01056545.1:319-960(+)
MLSVCMGHGDFITAMVQPGGSGVLLSASADCTLRVWDFLKGELLQSLGALDDVPIGITAVPNSDIIIIYCGKMNGIYISHLTNSKLSDPVFVALPFAVSGLGVYNVPKEEHTKWSAFNPISDDRKLIILPLDSTGRIMDPMHMDTQSPYTYTQIEFTTAARAALIATTPETIVPLNFWKIDPEEGEEFRRQKREKLAARQKEQIAHGNEQKKV